MHLENDKVFNELYDEEFEKIPFLFRFSRKRCIAVMIIGGIFIAAMLILTTVVYETSETVHISTVPGYDSFAINTFDPVAVSALVLVAIAVFIIAAWLAISKWFENRAFTKASKLANMIFLSEKHRDAVKWQNMKTGNPDF